MGASARSAHMSFYSHRRGGLSLIVSSDQLLYIFVIKTGERVVHLETRMPLPSLEKKCVQQYHRARRTDVIPPRTSLRILAAQLLAPHASFRD